jgi:RNA polymerase sigma factor (sigma-70 family)
MFRASSPAPVAPRPSVAACDDVTLQARIAAGDPQALSELYRCTRDALTRYLRGRCRNAADADDALQSTFESATRFLHGYRGDGSPRGWLFRVAAHSCSRLRRGKKNDPSLHTPLDQPGVDSLLVDDRVPDAEARIASRADVVLAAIEALEPLDQRVVLLRDGQGMSAKETAAQLGLSEAAVKSRLFRARRAIRSAALGDTPAA